MIANTSDFLGSFGHKNFDPLRLDGKYTNRCPVRDCSAKPESVPFRKGEMPWCRAHGLRLHPKTFTYWNGADRNNEARLRNFVVRPDLARAIALCKGMKAEAHRLGYEMSEDALSWNVFVSFAVARKLREAAEFLTDRTLRTEPRLYLWGRLIGEQHAECVLYDRLRAVRKALEPNIRTFVTEPDIMLIAPGEMLICIEAKFGSGNPLADDSPTEPDEKPSSRDGLLKAYLGDCTSEGTKRNVRREFIGPKLHSQLFRNIVFASEMAGEMPWHVVNLVSSTQGVGPEEKRKSYADPTQEVRAYLRPDRKHCFTFRTWEALHTALIGHKVSLAALDKYLHEKSAHYRPAFDLA